MTELAEPTILVVDDNPATLYTTTRVLRAAGFRVREAACGMQALAEAHAGVDLVVLDVNLPDVSGLEVCRQLRQDPSTARMPVIHLSATFVSDLDKLHGYEVGADGYLTHPVEPPVLLATVRVFLRARLAEDATRRSEARFRSIFDNVPDGIALLDAELRLLEVNGALARMLGHAVDALGGRQLGEVLAPEDRERIGTALAQSGSWRGKCAHDAGGERRLLDWCIGPHPLPGGFLALVTDVTGLAALEAERAELLARERAARAAAEHANRQKDEFLATVSHDLRTPLAAVANWARVLQEESLTPNQRREGFRAIERNAAIAVQLIADLLDVSRIVAGKLHLDLNPVDAVALVASALDVSHGAAGSKGVGLRLRGEPRRRWLLADPARLQQVVWNLVENAIKFTPRGGHVDVELRDVGEHFEIRVCDDGKGIPPELLPHVFDRFRQGAAGATQNDGLGLGLSIVRHIVETHRGTVTAESAGEGRGACFCVSLPLAPAPPG